MMRFISLLLGLPLILQAADIAVKNPAELEAAIKAAQAGDRIVLREGEWPNTVVKFKGKGTVDAPITLRAKVPGKTIFTGASALRMGGEFLVVEGLWFQDPNPSVGDTLEFRIDSKNLASNCRLTGCAVTLNSDLGNKDDKESRWVGLYGESNRIDHCLFQGKLTKGTTLVVWLGDKNVGRHVIEENYFGPREKLGKNGGETIRVGDSKTSMQKADCIVRRNLFVKCNGEAECISNKSCGNLYQGNSFVEVSGTLTLRHGNGCTVDGNSFFGNGAKGTGGIRVIGEDHVVKNNYLENLAGDEVRCSLTFMLGIPDSPAHGYFQVKRAQIQNNILVDCKHPIMIGLTGDKVEGAPSLPPVETVLEGNQVLGSSAQVVDARCDLSGITWRDNQFFGKMLGIPETAGIQWGHEPTVQKRHPIAKDQVGPIWWTE